MGIFGTLANLGQVGFDIYNLLKKNTSNEPETTIPKKLSKWEFKEKYCKFGSEGDAAYEEYLKDWETSYGEKKSEETTVTSETSAPEKNDETTTTSTPVLPPLLPESESEKPLIQTLWGKSGIKIKKKNKGKFTEYCNGNVTKKCIDKAKKSGNKKLIKRAIFAENARKWKK